MISSYPKTAEAQAQDVRVTDEALTVDLLDGHGSGEARKSLDRWLESRREKNSQA